MNQNRPLVGVGVMLLKGNKVLLGQRKGRHGAGEYGGFGGHLENLESFEDCAKREMAEEVGKDIKIKNLRMQCITNLTKYAPKHYIDIGMVAEWVSGEAKTMEPSRIEGWGWYDLDDLPQPLFGTLTQYIEAYRTGRFYFSE